MSNERHVKQRYGKPKMVVLPKAEKIIRGNGLNWTDTLGNTDTRYGKDTYIGVD